MLELFGVIGGSIIVASYIPQIMKIVKTKSAGDISLTFVFFIMAGSLLLTIYSAYIGDFIFAFINAFACMLSSVLVLLSSIYQHPHSTEVPSEAK